MGKLTSLTCTRTDEETINDILVPVKDDTNDQTSENEMESSKNVNSENSDDSASEVEDEDDSGWITPQNIAFKKQEVDSEVDDKPVKVACITSDFAIQVSSRNYF
jgi:rRNA maturation endonuclease Nob1